MMVLGLSSVMSVGSKISGTYCYIKGYFGYKNFGDEVLLLGLLQYLYTHRGYQEFFIETKNILWLTEWLARHSQLLPPSLRIRCVRPFSWIMLDIDVYVFGGGEVLSDARRFPHTGWGYLLLFWWPIFCGRVEWYGGVGSIRRSFTALLYSIVFPRAKHIVCRDSKSHSLVTDIVKQSSKKKNTVELTPVYYHDFAQDIVYTILQHYPLSQQTHFTRGNHYGCINLTPYLWNDDIKQQIITTVAVYKDLDWRYISGEAGVDEKFLEELRDLVPGISVYDWTQYTLQETITWMHGLKYGLTTRLHISLLMRWLGVPFTPFVYQEKVTKMLAESLPLV